MRSAVLEESALAQAQATIQNAMVAAGFNQVELARAMRIPPQNVSRMMAGRHNLRVKTFARALLACGYEVRFDFSKVRR